MPAAFASPPVIASDRCVPGHAVQQAQVEVAEPRPLVGVVADLDRGRFVDLDQRAAGLGEVADDAVEGVAGAQRRIAADRAGCTARGGRALTARSVSAAVARHASSGSSPDREAAIGDRVETGRLLGADDRLEERLGRRALGQRRARQRAEERREHVARARPPDDGRTLGPDALHPERRLDVLLVQVPEDDQREDRDGETVGEAVVGDPDEERVEQPEDREEMREQPAPRLGRPERERGDDRT